MVEKLSVIIPFFNEKEEVEETIKSIKATGGDSIPIVLVNDASDDQYDYRSVALKYNTFYIENPVCKGSGPSKQIGIEACVTEYFLVIDAHMRFYLNDWVTQIVDAIESDKHAIYCCRCKPWSYLTKQELNIDAHYGAYLKIIATEQNIVLEPQWIKKDFYQGEILVDIPCVLGASYASSKEYWMYIKGYECLESYGGEEAFISLKAWLEGGRCRLIKNVIIGHLFRDKFHYVVDFNVFLYNKILIANLLLPEILSDQVYSLLRKSYPLEYVYAKKYNWQNDQYSFSIRNVKKIIAFKQYESNV